jgi:preprotein translocase subunit SecF
VKVPRANVFQRLFRGETSFDFAGRWRRWFAISGIVILAGVVSLGFRGLNFSIEFKGGTQWTVPTTASVATARNVVGNVSAGLRQATIEQLVNRQTNKKEIQVSAPAKTTSNNAEVTAVSAALAKMAGVPASQVTLNAIGPSWGSDITNKAVRAVIIFLIACSIYIWLRFEGKMALAALVALLHDLVVTAGIYSLSGFQVSPDTVIAFLTILGYSLYDTIVVFDKVQENTRGLASTGRITYTDTVNVSMNAVLARSLNTSFVAILPILSILVIGSYVLGATALNDFGLALLIGLTTGAYSSIFIASPLLALLKEREPRYAQIRQAARPAASRRLTPAAAASGSLPADFDAPVPAGAGRGRASAPSRPPAARDRAGAGAGTPAGTAAPAGAKTPPGAGTPVGAAQVPGVSAPNGGGLVGAAPEGAAAGRTPAERPRKRVLTGGRLGPRDGDAQRPAGIPPGPPAATGRAAPPGAGGGTGGEAPANPAASGPAGGQGASGPSTSAGADATGAPASPGAPQRPAAARTGNRPPPRPRKKRRR